MPRETPRRAGHRSLVLASAEEDVGDLVAGRELRIRHLAEEPDVRGAESRHQLRQHAVVAIEPRVAADEQQARTRVEQSLVGVEVRMTLSIRLFG